MEHKKIAVIGCGNLGLSILNGLLDSKLYLAGECIVTKRNIHSLTNLKDVTITSDNNAAVRKSEIIIVALKPYNVLSVLEEVKNSFDPDRHVLISVATGITISQIKQVIGTGMPVFRAMPNTAADVKESITCLCSESTNSEHMDIVKTVFNAIGSTVVIDEKLMEAATVLGACGIAYVMRFMRAMVQGGIEIGFDAHTASKIVNQTVKGASQLLIERKQHPEFEIDKVTTPKGCTIVGLNEMEHHGFSSSLIRGLVASYQKIEK